MNVIGTRDMYPKVGYAILNTYKILVLDIQCTCPKYYTLS
jgi:hypothetical protein